MDVRISLLALHCSNQSLTGERDTSFPNELRSQLPLTSKSDSAGRLRWTSNRAKLPFPESRWGQEHWSGILIYRTGSPGLVAVFIQHPGWHCVRFQRKKQDGLQPDLFLGRQMLF